MTLDKIKLNIGLETLVIVSQIENIVNQKKVDNPKGLLRLFDMVGHYHDSRIMELRHVLQMRNKIFGKKYIRQCCEYAIQCHNECDIDLIPTLQAMHKSRKKLVSKNKKGLQ